jgi:protocatechuate 3,4-dioxygenase beta subunit
MTSKPLAVAVVAAVACTAHADPAERLVGGPCEGCELVFEGRPAKLEAHARIAPAQEPGDPLILDGVVRDRANKPVAGMIVYAYHTNAKGEYPPLAKVPHGKLRGFAKTGADGAYRFTTIRPASYPVANAPPQHIHMHVVEPGRCHYFIDDVVFTDDPRLTAEQRKQHERGRGGLGVVTPKRDKGTWLARRDITLGAGISDYDRCGKAKM